MIYELLDLMAWIFVIVVVGGIILTALGLILEKLRDWKLGDWIWAIIFALMILYSLTE
ncbi:MAG: hypothetical protein KAQ87_00160 [Candidatus Pacebacteria bacterium]|nr:hypothetical protein [Candidatus Paceibacterota bacterium]